MFLTPLFLVGGAIAAMIPILLHLFQRRRRTTVSFPTLRFLKLAQQKSSRALHLENLLLWLLRILIMLLLGAAFAMPVLRAQGLAWLNRAPRDVAIVIDASYSMGYRTGRDTVWDKAIAAATAVLKGLGENDRYCLYLGGAQPQPLIAEPISDREQAYPLLKAAAPQPTDSRLLSAVQVARAALLREQTGREQELYIFTDGQAVAWREQEGGADDAEAAATKNLSYYLTVLGPPTPVNLSPVSLEMKPLLLAPDAPARLRVRTEHHGPDRESILRLVVDEEEIGRRPLRLSADAPAEAEFTLPPRPPGVYPARVETPQDALAFDDTFHFLVRVRDRLPVLCVGTQQDTIYLMTALRTAMSAGAGLEPERIDVTALADYPLHQAAAVFLCNALPLAGQTLAPLEDYVQAGGLVVVFPGAQATAADYEAWTTLPLQEITIKDLARLERASTLSWSGMDDHGLMRRFQRGLAAPRLSINRHLAGTALAENARVLISQGPQTPFLLERDVGKGKLLLFTVAADRTWSDFPLSPFYLPLLAQLVEYSAGIGTAAPFYWAANSLPLDEIVPGATRETALFNPANKRVPISSAVIEGIAELRAENLDEPGIYRAADQTATLAINVPRTESDLAPLSDKELEEILDADPVYLARDEETLLRLVEDNNVGRTFGEHLLWIVMVLVAIEFIYANHLARARPALSDQLAVEPSGRIKGHPEATS